MAVGFCRKNTNISIKLANLMCSYYVLAITSIFLKNIYLNSGKYY